MLQLYNVGVAFYNALATIGYYTVDNSLSDFFNYVIQSCGLSAAGNDFFYLLIDLFGDYTLAGLVLGSGLLFIVAFKVVKFFTDLVL